MAYSVYDYCKIAKKLPISDGELAGDAVYYRMHNCLSASTTVVDQTIDQNPPQRSHKAVTQRYGDDTHHATLASNAVKLRAVMKFFGLTPTQIGRVTGVSRSFVSRIVSENDEFLGNDSFYRRLEQVLGALVQNRTRQIFAVEPIAEPDLALN